MNFCLHYTLIEALMFTKCIVFNMFFRFKKEKKRGILENIYIVTWNVSNVETKCFEHSKQELERKEFLNL